MTPRERVAAALQHRETDRVPIDFGGTRSTGIDADAYLRLCRNLGLDDGLPKLFDVWQQLAQPEQPVLDRLHGDVVALHRLRPELGIPIDRWRTGATLGGEPILVPKEYVARSTATGELEVLHGEWRVAHKPSGCRHLLRTRAAVTTREEAMVAAECERITEGELEFLEANARRLFFETDRAVLFCFGGSLLEEGIRVWGFERFLEALASEPASVLPWLERLTEGYLADLDRILARIGHFVQVVQFVDDLGTQDGPLISPTTYRTLLRPHHQRMFRGVRERSPSAQVMLHSCGAVRALLPDLIEAGVQVIDPVQTAARGMEPAELKREFGRDLVFWGGFDPGLMCGGVAQSQRVARVSELAQALGSGGGYVFATSGNVEREAEPEAILEVFDEASQFRR